MINLAEAYAKIKDSDGEFTDEMAETIFQIKKALDSCMKAGEEIVLEKISEPDFVKSMRVIQNTTLGVMVSEDVKSCAGLLMAELEDSLTQYTHSVILAAIGYLIQEEVL